MSKRKSEPLEYEISSGNIFADLDIPDAEAMKIKSGLVIEIKRAIERLRLTQIEASERMGLPQPKVSLILRGHFHNVSEKKLMDCLNRLGYDIEIKLKRTRKAVGQVLLAA